MPTVVVTRLGEGNKRTGNASCKQIERQHSKGGFTRLIAAIPTLCMEATPETVRRAFRAVDSKATQLWLKASLGKTLTARRNAAYRESRGKPCDHVFSTP